MSIARIAVPRGLTLITAVAVALAAFACGRPAPPPATPANPASGSQAAPPFRIVTSFYPIQIMAMNIADGIPGVTVETLTGPTTGCLHDYQLTPEALRSLADASVLVINGAGMESFLEKVAAQYPALTVIDASRGFGLVPGHGVAAHHDAHSGHGSGEAAKGNGAGRAKKHRHAEAPPADRPHHHHHHHDDDSINPHIWVGISGAMHQVRTIAEGLAAADPLRADRYRANAEPYLARLATLRAEMHAVLDPLPNRRIVTFHEAFPWFAHEFNLEIVAVVEREPGAEPGAGELASIIRLVRAKNVRVIFSEPQYSPRAAEVIAREAGARVYPLDPAVTGPVHLDAYLEIMRANLAMLKEALAS
jgi:zinc transport system substrate-binding protein